VSRKILRIECGDIVFERCRGKFNPSNVVKLSLNGVYENPTNHSNLEWKCYNWTLSRTNSSYVTNERC